MFIFSGDTNMSLLLIALVAFVLPVLALVISLFALFSPGKNAPRRLLDVEELRNLHPEVREMADAVLGEVTEMMVGAVNRDWTSMTAEQRRMIQGRVKDGVDMMKLAIKQG